MSLVDEIITGGVVIETKITSVLDQYCALEAYTTLKNSWFSKFINFCKFCRKLLKNSFYWNFEIYKLFKIYQFYFTNFYFLKNFYKMGIIYDFLRRPTTYNECLKNNTDMFKKMNRMLRWDEENVEEQIH